MSILLVEFALTQCIHAQTFWPSDRKFATCTKSARQTPWLQFNRQSNVGMFMPVRLAVGKYYAISQ